MAALREKARGGSVEETRLHLCLQLLFSYANLASTFLAFFFLFFHVPVGVEENPSSHSSFIKAQVAQSRLMSQVSQRSFMAILNLHILQNTLAVPVVLGADCSKHL